MYEKHIEVIGGSYESSTDEKGTKVGSSFVQGKRKVEHRRGERLREVVRESKLYALFRQDWELCASPVVKMRETTAPLTVVNL